MMLLEIACDPTRPADLVTAWQRSLPAPAIKADPADAHNRVSVRTSATADGPLVGRQQVIDGMEKVFWSHIAWNAAHFVIVFYDDEGR